MGQFTIAWMILPPLRKTPSPAPLKRFGGTPRKNFAHQVPRLRPVDMANDGETSETFVAGLLDANPFCQPIFQAAPLQFHGHTNKSNLIRLILCFWCLNTIRLEVAST